MVIPAITAHKSTNMTSFKGNQTAKPVIYQSGKAEVKQASRSSRYLLRTMLWLGGLGALGAGVSSCGKSEMQDAKPPVNEKWVKLKTHVLSYYNRMTGDTVTTNIPDSTALKETFDGDPMAIVQTLKIKTPESTTPDTFKFGTRILNNGNSLGQGEMDFFMDVDTLKSKNYSVDKKGKRSLSGISKYYSEGISLIERDKNNVKITKFTPVKLHEVDAISYLYQTTGKIIKIF